MSATKTLFITMIVFTALLGCTKGLGSAEDAGDSDSSAAGVDGDADADGDADGDTDTDTDADSDTDTDADSDVDGDADTDTTTDANTDTDRDTAADTNMDSDSEIETENEFPDCAAAMPIRCGDQLNGTTAGGIPNEWRVYACSAQGYSGPESMYVFEPDDDYEVEARLSQVSDGLNLFLVPECERDDYMANAIECTYRTGNYPEEASFTFTAVAGDHLFLIVDGLEYAEGEYTLALDCTAK